MVFSSTETIRFAHCDAAGILFYPRVFELLNAVIEDWFETLGYGFARLHGPLKRGIPTVELNAKFLKPLHLGDAADFTVTIAKLGRSSMQLAVSVAVKSVEHMRFAPVLVFMNTDTQKAAQWPDDLRALLTDYVQKEDEKP